MFNLINILRGKVPAERSGTVIKGWLKPTLSYRDLLKSFQQSRSTIDHPSNPQKLNPPPATMKTAFLQLALAALSYGYVVNVFQSSDCTGAAATYDLPSSGDCSGIPAGSSVKYQSDKGCVLSTYDSANCGGQKAVTRSQNECFSPGYQIKGVICH